MPERYFAEIKDGKVEQVIVADEAFIARHKLRTGKEYVETFPDTPTKPMARRGGEYDGSLKKFILPKPFPSWTKDVKGDWQPPKARPNVNPENFFWDEDGQKWNARPSTPQ